MNVSPALTASEADGTTVDFAANYLQLPANVGNLTFKTGSPYDEQWREQGEEFSPSRSAYAMLVDRGNQPPHIEIIYNVYCLPSKKSSKKSSKKRDRDDVDELPSDVFVAQRGRHDARPQLIMFGRDLFEKYIAGNFSEPDEMIPMVPENVMRKSLGMRLEDDEEAEEALIPLGCVWNHQFVPPDRICPTVSNEIRSTLDCDPGRIREQADWPDIDGSEVFQHFFNEEYPMGQRQWVRGEHPQMLQNVPLLCPIHNPHIKLLLELGPQPIEVVATEFQKRLDDCAFAPGQVFTGGPPIMFQRWLQFVSCAFYHPHLSRFGLPTHLGSCRIRHAPKGSIAHQGSDFRMECPGVYFSYPEDQGRRGGPMSFSRLPYCSAGSLRSDSDTICPIVHVRNGNLIRLYVEASYLDRGLDVPASARLAEDTPWSTYVPSSATIHDPVYMLCDGDLVVVPLINLQRHEDFLRSRCMLDRLTIGSVIETTGLPIGNLGSTGVAYPVHGSAIHNLAALLMGDMIIDPDGGVRLPTTTTVHDVEQLSTGWGLTRQGETNSSFFSGCEESITYPKVVEYVQACASRVAAVDGGNAIYDRLANAVGLVYLENRLARQRKELGTLREGNEMILVKICPSTWGQSSETGNSWGQTVSRNSWGQTVSRNRSGWGTERFPQENICHISDANSVTACTDIIQRFQQMVGGRRTCADKLHQSFCKFGFVLCDAELFMTRGTFESFRLVIQPWPGGATHRMPRVLHEVRESGEQTYSF